MRIQTLILTAAIVTLAALPAEAGQEGEDAADLEVTPLHQAPLPGTEGKEITVMRLAVPPGYVGERHLHPGPVYNYVLEGEVIIETEEGTQTGGAGELLVEPVGVAMQPRNASDSEPAEVLVFQVGPAGEPFMIIAE